MDVRAVDSLLTRCRGAIRQVFFLAAVLALAGCSGGGGGGGSAAAAPSGAFTLSANSATFTALQGGTLPASQSFVITLTGTGAAYVGAAYGSGQTQPNWLEVNITGSGTQYSLIVNVLPVGTSPGQYSTTFSVGTADSAGNVLAHQDFTVSLTLNAHIVVTTSPITQSLGFGDTRTTQAVPVSVTGVNRQWTASSDSTWLHVPTTSQSGSTTINATLDDTGLAPGTYNGQIQLASSLENDDTATLAVTLTVTPAALNVTGASFTFGGSDGRATLSPQAIAFSLSTGNGIFPFTATATTDTGGQWLSVDRTTGTVGAAGTSVKLSVNPALVHGGTYTGHVQIAATVNGMGFSQILPVTFNLEANRLIVTAAGIGLSQIAGHSVLTRTVQVLSAVGHTDSPWSATSDSAWLTVTPSGVTGGNLVLTANPAGQPLDVTQFANVTITSSDASVENQQSIRVGLFVSNTAPVQGPVSGKAVRLAASPVEPIVAIGNGGANVGIYDVNSGSLLRTLSNVVATSDGMAFSEDGRTLFVFDFSNYLVAAVDAVSGTVLKTYDSTALPGYSVGTAVAVMHPNGYPMLITPSGRTYDLTSGAQYTGAQFADSATGLAGSPDQSLLSNQDGVNIRLVRSALNGGTFVVQLNPVAVGTAGGRSGETCFSASGDRIYTASGYPYNFPATSVATGQVIQTLPGGAYPDSMQCVWNGLVIGGADDFTDASDIFVYFGPTGVSLASMSSDGTAPGYRDLIPRGLAVSADGTRLMSASSVGGSSNAATLVYFATLPDPPP